ncbi:MAG: CDP-glucose 4,6-dehydratase [Candidatus Binatia bacterium]
MEFGQGAVEDVVMHGTFITQAFRGRKVLVTGHTGFKGSWLSLWLHSLGARITGYGLAPATDPSNFVVSQVRDVLEGHYEADVRNIASLHAAIDQSDPDVIFHLAAQSLVRESYAAPLETFDTNVMGTVNLLEVLRRQAKPCVVVVVTSDKCYANREQVWGYREKDAMGGHDPYSASKGATELVVASYRHSFFPPDKLGQHRVKLASARAGNVIGGGDWSRDRIVVDLVTHLAQGKPVPVRNPRAVRPWQHVLEPLSGYLSLAAWMLLSDGMKYCAAWNFGPRAGGEATVQELVERFCQAWGGGRWVDVSDPQQPHEASILRLSIDKAAWELQWQPMWNLAQTVARTAAWYRRFYERPTESMRTVCLADLEAFMGAQPTAA